MNRRPTGCKPVALPTELSLLIEPSGPALLPEAAQGKENAEVCSQFQALLFFLVTLFYLLPMNSDAILAIETSVETGSVAFWSGGRILIERSFVAGRKPSASLWPSLQEVMAEISPLTAVVVGIGPGSYNGSRVGIAAAQGIALIHECPVVPICSFEGVALKTEQALAIGDARRGSFSLQRIVAGRISGGFSLASKEELVEAIASSRAQGEEVFSFDPAERFPVGDELQQEIQFRHSEASRLALAFAQRNSVERESLMIAPPEPFYLRDPHITVGKRSSLLDR